MNYLYKVIMPLFVAGFLVAAPAFAHTPDGETPAEETACDKYKGEGARYGLCVAYCEAQDCDDMGRGEQSCINLAQNFIDWSAKKGYKQKPKPGETINCRVSACTTEDTKICFGVERDCEIGGMCQSVCTRTFEGYGPGGRPLCSLTKVCKKCIGEIPKVH